MCRHCNQGIPRGAFVRAFLNGRLDAGVNFVIARGYTGLTTENFRPLHVIQQVVGVRLDPTRAQTLPTGSAPSVRLPVVHSYHRSAL